MHALLAPLPPTWRQTITFDNGTEFARHYDLHALGLETFFCETHSPWQKGGVENAIGRLRRTLPRKTDLATLSEEHFTRLVQVYNNTPRKCLGYQTPAEVLGTICCTSNVNPPHVKHGDDGSRGSPVFRQGTRSLRWEGVAPRKLLLREDPIRVFHRRPDRGHPVEVDAGPMADPRLDNHSC